MDSDEQIVEQQMQEQADMEANEGGSIQESQNQGNQESKASLAQADSDQVQMVIPGEVEDDNQANELLKSWMKDPENREFVAKHNYQNKWEAGNDENGNSAILAYFKKSS